MRFTLSILLVFVLLNVNWTEGVCCPKSTGWGCCGWLECNIFCCNCGGARYQSPCDRSGECVPIRAIRGKRDLSPVSQLNVMDRFHLVDLNGDGLIDFNEAVVFKHGPNGTELADLGKGLMKLDLNNDGFIAPYEFDKSLA